MGSKGQIIKSMLTDAIIELCRKEAFYVEELRIEGTLCLVSDRSSVLIAQITEQIGEKPSHLNDSSGGDKIFPFFDYDQEGEGQDADDTRLNKSKDSKAMKHEAQGVEGEESSEDGVQKGNGVRSLLPTERTDGKYKCPFCPKVYSFKHHLKDHINKHTGKKPHICKYCGMTFANLANMCAHIKRRHFHSMPRDFECDICQNRFPNEQSLRQHHTWRHSPGRAKKKQKNNVSNVDADPLAAWGESQSDNRPLKQGKQGKNKNHKEPLASWDSPNEGGMEDGNHADGQMKVKKEIEKIFVKQESPLLQDDAVEEKKSLLHKQGSTEKLAQSNEGPAISSAPQQLTTTNPHEALMRMHLPMVTLAGFPMLPPPGLPMFTHPTSLSLTSAQQMTAQQMSALRFPLQKPKDPSADITRSPDGKFQCPYCDKAYNFKHTLKDHMNTHFGKKPHVCKHCGDSFTHFASLCAHIKRRHKETIPTDFQCEICKQNFMNLQSLKQHYTWRHKDQKFPLMKTLGGESGSARSSPGATATETQPNLLTARTLPSPVSVPHPLLSPTSPTLPSVDAFMKGGAMALPAIPIPHMFPHEQFMEHFSAMSGLAVAEKDATDLSNRSTAQADDNQSDDSESEGQGQVDETETKTSEGQSSPKAKSVSVVEFFEQVEVKTRHGLYRYKCKTCGNMFKVRNSLYEHMNSHLGRKPHVCTHCGDSFTHHSSLHNHIRNKHLFRSPAEKQAALKHQCPGCDRRFRYPSELDRHLLTNPDHDPDRGSDSATPVIDDQQELEQDEMLE